MASATKRINKIEREVASKIDEMVLRNIEELNKKAYDYFNPFLEEMQEIVMAVYSHPYMDIDTFSDYVERLVEISKPFRQDERDEILLKLSEDVIVKNKKILTECLEHMIEEFVIQRIPITNNQALLEWKKMQQTAASRMMRFFNLNYKELNAELNAICEFAHDSLIAYGKSPRVVEDEMEIEIEVINYEESNQYIKMTDFDQMVCWLESQGYKLVRVAGSHHIYKKDSHAVPVPLHKGKDFNKFLAYQIQKEVYRGVCC